MQSRIQACSAVTISYLLYISFTGITNIPQALVLGFLSSILCYFCYLEHSEKHIVAEDKLKAVQAELLERLTQMDKLYAKKLERMEDELGKVSLSLVQRASSPSFMESQSKSGKKIQF